MSGGHKKVVLFAQNVKALAINEENFLAIKHIFKMNSSFI